MLLSVLGLASMTVPAASALAAGAGFVDAVGSADGPAMVFVVVRILHVAAVVAATVAMFLPASNDWFRPGRAHGPRGDRGLSR